MNPNEQDEKPHGQTPIPEDTPGAEPRPTMPGDEAPDDNAGKQPGAPRRHRRPVRVILRILMWIVIIALAIPFLLYLPPVQNLLTSLASRMVHDATGMELSIESFRLRFPLDVTLEGVSMVEASGDTMMSARSAEVDVRLLPLLHMQVDVTRLRLLDGTYRMVSPDSSMTLRLRAGELIADDSTRVSLNDMHIALGQATLRHGDVSLYMDVWRQTPKTDTTATRMLIEARRLNLEDFTFAMSMRPTIDTLRFTTESLTIDDGRVNLTDNDISARILSARGGDVTYLTPTPEYIAAHPVPADTVQAVPSPPMVIRGDSVSLDSFKVLYAVRDAEPAPGFDPSYISLSGVSAGVRGFYNASSTLKIPVTRLAATERCGLQVTSGSGTLGIDASGMALSDLRVQTPWSSVDVTAGLPFALMQMQPDAPLDVTAAASVGWPDIEAFMPSLRQYTSMMPARSPLNLRLTASGRLDNADIKTLDVAVPGTLSLRASGTAVNALRPESMTARVKFDGEVSNPAVVRKLAGVTDIAIPRLRLHGTATADRQTYGADFALMTPEGDVAGRGRVGLTSELYDISLDVDNVNVAYFMPDLGVGHVTARLAATGAGFNPEIPSARTDIRLDLDRVRYNGHLISDIRARVGLEQGAFTIDADSRNAAADLALTGSGRLEPDNYRFDITADVRHFDLHTLGITDSVCNGSVTLSAKGMVAPRRWLCDVDLAIPDMDVQMGSRRMTLPGGVTAHALSTPMRSALSVDGRDIALLFESPYNIRPVIDRFSAIASVLPEQLKSRHVEIGAMLDSLPSFRLRLNGNDRGLLQGLLTESGLALDTVWADLGKDSLVRGNMGVRNLTAAGMAIDTIGIRLSQRGSMLDYTLHMGNRPGTLDEFAQVDLKGYLATNRLAMSLTQHNIQGEQGYRLGLTAAMADSTATIHFTPLNATIAYLPWRFNLDNHVDYDFGTRMMTANLEAASNESSIMLRTEPVDSVSDANQLHMALKNIRIEDFLNMMINPPAVTGVLDSDMTLLYDGHSLEGDGKLGLHALTFEHKRIGDLDFTLRAGRDNAGDTRATLGLDVDGNAAMALHTELVPDSASGMLPQNTFLSLMDFPLAIANPFMTGLGSLSGTVSGRMDLGGDFKNPVLNGQIACDSVGVYVTMLGTTLRFDEEPLTVRDNVLRFNRFDILAANDSPLTIDGTVDASRLSAITLDLSMAGQNFMLLNNKKQPGAELYGKLALNIDATAKGPLQHFDINGSLNILGNTDVTYDMAQSSTDLTAQQNGNVVKFVNFSDTTQVAVADSVAPAMAMRINASATFNPGCQITANLNMGQTAGKVELSPSGTLSFFQNYMGDQRLNGTLTLGEGYVKVNIKPITEKKFTFQPSSSIVWNGPIMNPVLNIHADYPVKANVATGSNTQLVNFDVALNVTGNMTAPNVGFDVSTEDDMTIQNQLQSMSADQRQTQAMNLLLMGRYTADGTKTVSSNMVTGQLYNMLAAQLNTLAASAIKGVDLSFGVNQYESGTDGRTSTTTSYSYQVSKSLFDNRFKILVGGNYSTDASADENFAENLISDISFEYTLRQTPTASLVAKLFRHMGYENVLEGEVTQTGVGLVMKRRLSNLRSLFRLWGRRKTTVAAETDSTGGIPAAPADTALPDSREPVDITRQRDGAREADTVPAAE